VLNRRIAAGVSRSAAKEVLLSQAEETVEASSSRRAKPSSSRFVCLYSGLHDSRSPQPQRVRIALSFSHGRRRSVSFRRLSSANILDIPPDRRLPPRHRLHILGR